MKKIKWDNVTELIIFVTSLTLALISFCKMAQGSLVAVICLTMFNFIWMVTGYDIYEKLRG